MRRPAARRLLDQVVEQGRLAHPGLPAHHQDPALTGADRVEEPVQQVTFTAPTPQLPGAPPLMDGAASARHRHYAAPTTPWRNPQFSASCSAISIKASMSGLRESGRMARQPPNTKRNAPTVDGHGSDRTPDPRADHRAPSRVPPRTVAVRNYPSTGLHLRCPSVEEKDRTGRRSRRVAWRRGATVTDCRHGRSDLAGASGRAPGSARSRAPLAGRLQRVRAGPAACG
jgi:hypothetical protein